MTELTAPLEGKALPLSEVPDPIFAGGRLGDGVAIEPSNNTVVAPADAKVLMVQKSGHAVALRLDSGVEVLIHVVLIRCSSAVRALMSMSPVTRR